MKIFDSPNYDFVRWRWHAIAVSVAVILAGAFVIMTRGLPLGVDFAGGTIVIVKFDKAPSVEQVRAAITNLPGGLGNDASCSSTAKPRRSR
jgi:preprotein translocase subunit SecF